jgi:predicted dienelactone hydrolase
MNFTRPIQAISLVLCVSVFSAAQGPAEQTPAGRQLAGWLAAYDGTDWDVYLTFLKANFAIQPRGGFLDPALRDRTGGYDLKKIERVSPTEVTGLIQERVADGLARFVLEVEPENPHRILKLDVTRIERRVEYPTAQGFHPQSELKSEATQQTEIPKLPSPTGRFGVGRVSYEWVDVMRPDGHSTDPQAHRDLMVYLWYPSLKGKAKEIGEYLPGAKLMDANSAVRPVMQEEFGTNWQFIVSGAVSSLAAENAPVAASTKRFPVVILAHGLGGTSFEYTALIEDLVSHGYVVAAIENTYMAAAVVFPDGRIIPSYHEPEPSNLSPDQRFQRMMKSAGQEIDTGARDIVFVLNQLTELDNENGEKFVLGRRLDLNRVATIGHSAGGANATLACQLDARFKACVSLDGAMPPFAAFPENPDANWFTQPVLLLEVDHSGQRRGFSDAQNVEYFRKKENQLNKCPAGSYDVLLKSAGLLHASFSDYPLLSANGQSTETEVALHNLRLTESFTLAFLDKSLNHAREPLFDGDANSPEATITRYGQR